MMFSRASRNGKMVICLIIDQQPQVVLVQGLIVSIGGVRCIGQMWGWDPPLMLSIDVVVG